MSGIWNVNMPTLLGPDDCRRLNQDYQKQTNLIMEIRLEK